MIRSVSSKVTLAYCEVVELENYLRKSGVSLEQFLSGASFGASANGITVYCVGNKMADDIWNAISEARSEEEGENDNVS